MDLFAIHALDKPDSLELRLANRPRHLDWVRAAGDRVRVAGPLFAEDGETFAGSMLIVEGESLKAVRAWAASDPYAMAGLFARVEIHPFRWLIGEGRQV